MNTIDPTVFAELNERYIRVSQNVCFDLMMSTTIVVVGTGASGQMIEGFCRLGVKKFHLFDLDTVEVKNLAAQNFTHDDIDLPKPVALKARLHACEFERDNPALPSLEVVIHGDFLAPSDVEIKGIIEEEQSAGQRVIFIMASDFHPVQARGARIALKFSVPVFFVGIYRMGMAGEIIFYEGGHDLPCYRCITEERYRHWDKNHLAGFISGTPQKGAGRSAGLPMAASFIDAILSHLIIGAIHKDMPNNQHGTFYSRLLAEKRNFIQTQLDPMYLLGDEDIFAQVQGKDIITFNTIFQQEGIKDDCIDCYDMFCNHEMITHPYRWSETNYVQEKL